MLKRGPVEEKRRYPRYRFSFPIESQRANLPKYSYTVTKDLSLGGAKILSNEFVPKGITLKVSLNLIKHVFNFKAKVAWCNRDRFSDRYYLGYEFVEVPRFYKNRYGNFLATIN